MLVVNRCWTSFLVAVMLLLRSGLDAGAAQPRGNPLPPAETDAATSSASRERVYDDVHALCIGIDTYRSGGIGALKWSVADAQAVAELFTNHYGYRVQTLIGPEATKDRILETLREFEKSLGPNDALVIFFAGHGQTVELDQFGRRGFMVPFDAQLNLEDTRDPEEWKRESIDMREIGDMAVAMKCRHVLLLVDACYSGFLGRRSGLAGRKDYEELMWRKSRMVITAGTEDQKAFELEKLRHGLFTHVLLKELSKPWANSASDVFVGLRNGVSNLSKGQMLPQLREIVVNNGEFVFLPRAINEKALTTALKELNERANKRSARKTEPEDVFKAFEALDYRYATNAPEEKRHWEATVKRFEDNASLGDPLAMAGLHYCYSKGLGVEKDLAVSYDWAQRAYDSGHPAGKHVLGRCYSLGYGVGKNDFAANQLIREAAENGFAISMETVAIDLLAERLDANRARTAINMVQRAVEAGLMDARMTLAKAYIGHQVEIVNGAQKAIGVLQPAVEMQMPEALFLMGHIYDCGEVGFPPRDAHKALEFLTKAALGGYGDAQDCLAAIYYFDYASFGIEKNARVAKRWAELAAREGNPRSEVVMATMYRNGDGVPEDYQKAQQHCEKAAAAHYAPALELLERWKLMRLLESDDTEPQLVQMYNGIIRQSYQRQLMRLRNIPNAEQRMIRSDPGLTALDEVGGEISFLSTYRKANADKPARDLVYSVDLSGRKLTYTALEYLRELAHLKSLDLSETNITDQGLERLTALIELERLNLKDTRISDRGVEHLSALPSLKLVDFDRTDVTDAGLAHLKNAGDLEHLSLNGTNIMGPGLARLHELRKLRRLMLKGTEVSDADLDHLLGLTSLGHLDVSLTLVTDAGLAKLKGLTTLGSLYVDCSHLTDVGLANIGGINSLEVLGFEGHGLTRRDVAKMQESVPQISIRADLIARRRYLPPAAPFWQMHRRL